MSCKILRREDQSSAQPFKWRELDARGTANGQATSTTTSTQPPQEPGELKRLHGRIVELERALEQEVKQARDRAYQEGHKAGRDSASAELQPVMERLARSCADIAGLRARIRRDTESDLVTLTIAIAKRVLRRELSVDPEAIHGVVKAALQKVQTKEITLVRTHPDHAAAIRTFLDTNGLGAGVEVAADATMAPGGVVIETKRGNLDASVETQLKEIERGFADRLST